MNHRNLPPDSFKYHMILYIAIVKITALQSVEFVEIFLNLGWSQDLEFTIFSHNTNLDVVATHLALKSFLESQ